jgi:hypothetical protein
MTWRTWATPVQLAFRPRFVFVTMLIITQTVVVAFAAGYLVLQVRQFRGEQRAHNCQGELNDQLRDPRAGTLNVCRGLRISTRLQGPPFDRDTATPGPAKPPATGKTPAMR